MDGLLDLIALYIVVLNKLREKAKRSPINRSGKANQPSERSGRSKSDGSTVVEGTQENTIQIGRSVWSGNILETVIPATSRIGSETRMQRR